MAAGTLYSYRDNFRAAKAFIAAQYSKANVKLAPNFVLGQTNKSKEFLSKFPGGKVPAFQSNDGKYLQDSNAIAYYVANDQLRGENEFDSAQILQWILFAECEVLPAGCAWVFPILRNIRNNVAVRESLQRAKDDMKVALAVLDSHLLTRTYLVGERITLADIVLACNLLNPYKYVLDPDYRRPFPNVNRWFITLINQPQFKAVLGDVDLCSKVAQAGAASQEDLHKSASFKMEDDSEDDGVSCSSSTPNLLILSHSRDYNPCLEKQIQIMEQNRSLSRISSGVGRSDMSEASEIINIFDRRRTRKRKRKRSNWTHRKRRSVSNVSELSSRSFPMRSRDRGPNNTPLSERSYIGFYTRNKRTVSASKSETRSKAMKIRTRSLSRIEDVENKYLEELENMKWYCKEPGCPMFFDELDNLNDHKILDHEIRPLYFCEECRIRYTTAKHLKLHQKTHEVGPFWCLLCFAEMANQDELQAHLEQHMSYSVPCQYCDKSFLNKALREDHIKLAHTEKCERISYKKKLILDRIDKDNKSKPLQRNNDSLTERPYRVFMAPFTDIDCYLTDADSSLENTGLMNIDFNALEETIDSSGSKVVEQETTNISFEVA